MRLDDILSKETFVTSVVFNENSVEITYMEKEEQSETIMLAKTILVPIYPDDEERVLLYAEMQDAASDLVDRAFVELRNPEEVLTGKSAIHRRMVERD